MPAEATIIGLLSGWFWLMAKYPDHPDKPILRIAYQSGGMALGTSLRGILTLSVCPSGLRIGIMRVFGPFCRDFFVPWESIAVIRKTILFLPCAELQFGNPAAGTLSIQAHVADRLARSAMGRWPETGPFPEEKRIDVIRRLLTQCAVYVCFLGVLFMLAFVASHQGQSQAKLLFKLLNLLLVVVVGTVLLRFYRKKKSCGP